MDVASLFCSYTLFASAYMYISLKAAMWTYEYDMSGNAVTCFI